MIALGRSHDQCHGESLFLLQVLYNETHQWVCAQFAECRVRKLCRASGAQYHAPATPSGGSGSGGRAPGQVDGRGGGMEPSGAALREVPSPRTMSALQQPQPLVN